MHIQVIDCQKKCKKLKANTKLDVIACRQCLEYTYFVDPFKKMKNEHLVAV